MKPKTSLELVYYIFTELFAFFKATKFRSTMFAIALCFGLFFKLAGLHVQDCVVGLKYILETWSASSSVDSSSQE